MNRRALAALALAIAATPAAAEDAAASWAREQARAYRAWLERKEASPPLPRPGAQLWRERSAGGALIPGFVPPTSLAPLVRAVSPGVVNVSSVSDVDGTRARRALGSGFVISPDGFVVTNNHVVELAQTLLVQLADGREYLGEVVGRDASTDVALLRLQGAPGDLPSVYLGDSDALSVGDWVVAIGNPFGLDHSVSHGMISAKERVIGIGVFDDFIQTDALINPGNSGGPLFDMRGEVIGVTTAVSSQGQGIGFAVPINMVKDLIPNLRENGRLARGWLGVNIVEANERSRGAVVSEVYSESPAERAGLRPGDRVLSVNGRAVENYMQLLRRVAFLPPGSKATLEVERERGREEIAVTLAERPAQRTPVVPAGALSDVLGLFLRDTTTDVQKNLGHEPRSGALVAGVAPRSAAERAGLRPGDLITEANRRPVRSAEDFREVVRADEARGTVLVRFKRGDAVRYVALSGR